MEINTLLKGKLNCHCGMDHTCAIENVIIRNGAVNDLPALLEKYNHILLVADQNTFAVGGEKTSALIGDKLENTLIYQSGEHFLVPNEDAIAKMEALVTDETDLIIGVGSGVINDTCKYVSFTHKLPYYIVATAPSMDGYASVGAAMIINSMKITYDAHVPTAIIGDVDMLKTAPIDMIKSGYGDIIGKYSALNDWKLSHLINDEYICEYVYDLTFEMIEETLKISDGILNREDDSIRTLMEALVVVGIAMSFVGNSRPASGSEHHLSHFFEIVGLLNNEPYFNHGIDVVYSTVMTQRLREEILALDHFEAASTFDQMEWEEHIRRIYTDAADGIIELQNKLGWYQKDYISVYKTKEAEIKKVLAEVPSAVEIENMLAKVELYMPEFVSEYGEAKIREATFIAKDLKNRF
ncbi:MAG: sn-glycerol-1-phosphate dehydrogenase, partial [Clostridia bacterium]|nr:sn-glycerol-1-phosphate dehydrogenase [Clostridia bacterium]